MEVYSVQMPMIRNMLTSVGMAVTLSIAAAGPNVVMPM